MSTLFMRSTWLLGASTAGVSACFVAALISEHMTRKVVAFGLAGVFCLILAISLRQARAPAMMAWIFLLTYYRCYFVDLFGNHGGYSAYVLIADAALVALALVWVLNVAWFRQPAAASGGRSWLWFMPFVVVCAVSTLGADDRGPAAADLLRVVKFLLILALLRYNLGRFEWWSCIAALGLTVAFQSTYGLIQVTTGKLNSATLDGGEWRRASGTMVHPNILAPYLLLVTPLFLALVAAFDDRRLRLLALTAGLLGSGAIAASLSRAPWAILLIQLILLVAGLAVLGYLSLKQALGLGLAGTFVLALALAPVAPRLMERLTSNLSESMDFRVHMNRIAYTMFSERPWFGAGPSNFSTHLLQYDPSFVDAARSIDAARELNIRAMAAVHNFYLLLLAETGFLGVAAMFGFFAAVLWRGVRSIQLCRGPAQLACLGLLIGVTGLLIEELMDFSLWIDPAFYTFALVAALLWSAPSIADYGPQWAGEENAP